MTAAAITHHIAIVMDGNGRWENAVFCHAWQAQERGGLTAPRARLCRARVKVLTVFAFSSENWNRQTDEVDGMMNMLAGALAKEVPSLARDGIRLFFVGDRASLLPRCRRAWRKPSRPRPHDRMVLNVCFNYGGRWDIAQAAAKLAAAGQAITECGPQRCHGAGPCAATPICCRTGGEMRISNFYAVAIGLFGAVFQ
ncbi:polyprenyl diphosphate synthase [Comamonas sp. JC664]|uniref:polyprenyl diphosphate synthase n=1 Tax=Comamonas sp. JC664 TaxID=2801917 RepID=UPI00360737EB